MVITITITTEHHNFYILLSNVYLVKKMKSIEIVENDSDMLTVKINGSTLVYNKHGGYWYDCEKEDIVTLNEKIVNAVFAKAKPSNDIIEDFANYVYHNDE